MSLLPYIHDYMYIYIYIYDYMYLFLKFRENSRFTTNTTIKMDKKTCVGLGLIKKKDDQNYGRK